MNTDKRVPGHARGAAMLPRYALAPLALATLLMSTAAHAGVLDDTYISPMFSYAIADDGRHTKDGIGGTLGFGWRLTERTELELLGTYLKYRSDGDYGCTGPLGGNATCPARSDELGGGGVGINSFLTPGPGGPFIHMDVMAADEAYLHAGLGYDFAFSKSGMALRAEALLQGDVDGKYKEPLFNIGLRIPLGAARDPVLPPPIPVPVAVVEPTPPPPPPPPPPCEVQAGSPVDFSSCKTGDTVVLRGVNFDFDKSTLTADATLILDGVADALSKRSDIKVEVDGHTDSKGTDSYNQKLSERRAKSVVTYLTGKGITADRLSSKGFGESAPIADNTTDEGREINRRVELKVLEATGGAVTVEQSGKPAETIPAVPAAESPAAEPAPMAEMDHAAMAAPASADTPAVAPVAGTAVSIENMAFTPAVLEVAAGSTVVFTNNDGSNHIITFADGTKSPRLPMGKTFERVFSTPGEYPYACSIHPQMTGKVVVK